MPTMRAIQVSRQGGPLELVVTTASVALDVGPADWPQPVRPSVPQRPVGRWWRCAATSPTPTTWRRSPKQPAASVVSSWWSTTRAPSVPVRFRR